MIFIWKICSTVTPLEVACSVIFPQTDLVVRNLLERGANISHMESNGETS